MFTMHLRPLWTTLYRPLDRLYLVYMRSYPVHAFVTTPTRIIALDDGEVSLNQDALLVIHKTFGEPSLGIRLLVLELVTLALDARACIRIRIATPYAVTAFQALVVGRWHAFVMPHEIRVIELKRRGRVVVNIVDNFDSGCMWLVIHRVRPHLSLEDCAQDGPLTIALFLIHRIYLIVQFSGDILSKSEVFPVLRCRRRGPGLVRSLDAFQVLRISDGIIRFLDVGGKSRMCDGRVNK